MKTTLEIPDQLFREAEAKAALEGIKLNDFVAESIQLRLKTCVPAAAEPGRRIQLPVVRSSRPGSMNLTGEMIAEMEARLDTEGVL